jgi:hypothetical protein
VIAKTPLMVAVGLYLSEARFAPGAAGLTLALSAALWAALYALNEATDLTLERGLTVSPRMRAFLFAPVCAVCLATAFLSLPLASLFMWMAAGQIAYCAPPLRLKRWWWAVLFLSGVMNPLLRLECGAQWGAHPIPLTAGAVVVSLHLGASMRSRALLRERDRRLGYVVAPPGSEIAGMFLTGAGLLGGAALCAQGALPRVFLLFGPVVVPFALYAWSGRVTSMARLRQGWLWFAVLACLALAILLHAR